MASGGVPRGPDADPAVDQLAGERPPAVRFRIKNTRANTEQYQAKGTWFGRGYRADRPLDGSAKTSLILCLRRPVDCPESIHRGIHDEIARTK